MRANTKKKLTVLFSTACAAAFAATGLTALGNLNASADGTDPAPASTEKALYFVDAGRLVAGNNPSDLESLGGRALNPSWGAVAAAVSPFMTEYGYQYRGTEGEATLLNSVSDKPFFDMNGGSTPNLEAAESHDPDSRWGFVLGDPVTGKPCSTEYGWADWRISTTQNSNKGFETVRWTESGNDKVGGNPCTLMYKFEVPENMPVNIYFGTGRFKDWDGDIWFDARVNHLAYKEDNSSTNTAEIKNIKGHRSNGVACSFDRSFTGVKEVLAGDTEENARSYVTIEFGASNTGTDYKECGVSWILVTTAEYAQSYDSETSYVKGSNTNTVNLMPRMDCLGGDLNSRFYGQGTLTSEMITELDAAADWSYVNKTITTSDGKTVDAKILVLPSNTAYFVNAGYDAAYDASHGYGYTYCENSNNRGYLDKNYDESRRYTGGNGRGEDGDIHYQFDNLSAGLYGVKVGGNDPNGWGGRTTPIEIEGGTSDKTPCDPLVCQQGVATNVTNYVTLSAAGNLTVKLLSDAESVDPCFTYIHIFKAAKITFDLNYADSTNSTASVGIGEKVSEPAEPVRTNWAFEGWYKESACENKFDFATETVSADTTLYAKWTEAAPRTVTFKNGNETIKTVENVTHGTKLNAGDVPADPSKENYFFGGWQIEGGAKFDPANDAVTKDLTLVPVWIPDPLATESGYTVAQNTGSGNNMSLISNWEGDLNKGGKKIYLAKGMTTVVTLVANGGNNRDKGLVLSLLNGSNRINFTGTRTYWFSGCSDTEKGSYVAHVEENSTYAGLEVAFHYTSKGELLNAYGSDILQVGKATLNTDNTITYIVETYAASDTIFANLIGKVEYTITIQGFSGDEYAVNFAYDACGSTLNSASVKYVTANNTEYTLSFSTDGGSEVTDQTVRGVQNVTKPADPVKDGYRFDGWFEDAECNTAFNFDTTISQNVTVYAKWTKTVNVTFDLNGGTGTAETQKVAADEKVQEPTCISKKGYDLEGWYTDAELTQKYDFNTTAHTADLVLKAKWTPKTYTVTLDANGGALNAGVSDTLSFTYGAAISGLPQSTDLTAPEGKVFRGWFHDATTEGDHYHSNNGELWLPDDADELSVTLYAHWGSNYSVTFDLEGGEGTGDYSTQTVEPNGKVIKPAVDPTRTGYTFAYWYKSGASDTAFDFDSEITQNTNLHAKWIPDKHTVTFNTNGGSAVDPVQVDYDTKVSMPAAPTREGYTFGGWYKDEACTVEFDFENDVITEDIMLYAKWNPNTTVPEKPDEGKKGGCKSSVSAPLAIVGGMLALGTAAIVIKKKKTNK